MITIVGTLLFDTWVTDLQITWYFVLCEGRGKLFTFLSTPVFFFLTSFPRFILKSIIKTQKVSFHQRTGRNHENLLFGLERWLRG